MVNVSAAISSMIGIGGRVLYVPILFAFVLIVSGYFMIKTIKEIQDKFINQRKWGYWLRKFGEEEYSVNLLIGLPLSALSGFWGHFFAGHFEPKMALILALVVFAGAQAGSRISIKVDKILLKKIYAIFLFLISAWMVVSVV
ncbi:unnamed protein product [marine sediment metagenome]|uniref:Membrane transporter protein n=1 Tax=marine sediment metagenome TaxID=412755 RepID=X0ZW72_9ZZZZ